MIGRPAVARTRERGEGERRARRAAGAGARATRAPRPATSAEQQGLAQDLAEPPRAVEDEVDRAGLAPELLGVLARAEQRAQRVAGEEQVVQAHSTGAAAASGEQAPVAQPHDVGGAEQPRLGAQQARRARAARAPASRRAGA